MAFSSIKTYEKLLAYKICLAKLFANLISLSKSTAAMYNLIRLSNILLCVKIFLLQKLKTPLLNVTIIAMVILRYDDVFHYNVNCLFP